MVIEHAERFGLAQLHQLRGRVGRGAAESTCILLFEEPLSETARQRAEGDLRDAPTASRSRGRTSRSAGPGEFLGARQSGVPMLRFADIERDVALIEQARDAADELLAKYPAAARRAPRALARRQAGVLQGMTPPSTSSLDARFAPVVAHRPGAGAARAPARIWSEGPVWIAEDDSVLWSDIPNDRMLRWSARDGMTRVARARRVHQRPHARPRRHDPALLARPARRVSHGRPTAADQRIVVDRWQGKRFNAPNDIVVKSDGTIWFTDPPYGLIIPEEGHGGESEIGDCYVFRFDPGERRARSGDRSARASPNGLAFSPDESTLYVSDTSAALAASTEQPLHLGVRRRRRARRSPTGACSPRSRPACPTASASTRKAGSTRARWTACRCSIRTARCSAGSACPRRSATSRSAVPRRDTLYIAASTSLYRIRLRDARRAASVLSRP